MNIEDRLIKLRLELQALNQRHDAMVIAKQAADQEFQQNVQKNQNRFQQLTGIIAELEDMQKELMSYEDVDRKIVEAAVL